MSTKNWFDDSPEISGEDNGLLGHSSVAANFNPPSVGKEGTTEGAVAEEATHTDYCSSSTASSESSQTSFPSSHDCSPSSPQSFEQINDILLKSSTMTAPVSSRLPPEHLHGTLRSSSRGSTPSELSSTMPVTGPAPGALYTSKHAPTYVAQSIHLEISRRRSSITPILFQPVQSNDDHAAKRRAALVSATNNLPLVRSQQLALTDKNKTEINVQPHIKREAPPSIGSRTGQQSGNIIVNGVTKSENMPLQNKASESIANQVESKPSTTIGQHGISQMNSRQGNIPISKNEIVNVGRQTVTHPGEQQLLKSPGPRKADIQGLFKANPIHSAHKINGWASTSEHTMGSTKSKVPVVENGRLTPYDDPSISSKNQSPVRSNWLVSSWSYVPQQQSPVDLKVVEPEIQVVSNVVAHTVNGDTAKPPAPTITIPKIGLATSHAENNAGETDYATHEITEGIKKLAINSTSELPESLDKKSAANVASTKQTNLQIKTFRFTPAGTASPAESHTKTAEITNAESKIPTKPDDPHTNGGAIRSLSKPPVPQLDKIHLPTPEMVKSSDGNIAQTPQPAAQPPATPAIAPPSQQVAKSKRRIVIDGFPKTASLHDISRALYGGAIEAIYHRPGESSCEVLFLEEGAAAFFYKSTGNGVRWPACDGLYPSVDYADGEDVFSEDSVRYVKNRYTRCLHVMSYNRTLSIQRWKDLAAEFNCKLYLIRELEIPSHKGVALRVMDLQFAEIRHAHVFWTAIESTEVFGSNLVICHAHDPCEYTPKKK